ncbi:iron-containing alcohol dehydrogenase [Maledivibacter halophilus]|uniref:Alcohol dehydrogenase, class IV n=1 Tax=Maledivibacter halophilus TaxID=36842 RepID=A0A1T5MP77_9FIRM|nr:iron-containing alcohol dehydrogenase [Maledivibacter halophilus]SKC90037.1 Alcohol dehydrogenase, class IV [Maledivibacter halophilus]
MDSTFNVPTKIHFGAGEIENLSQIAKTYGKKCLLVTTENIYPLNELFSKIKGLLTEHGFEVVHFDKVIPNPTTEVVEKGIKILNENNIDFVLSVGGGSSIDTAKIISLLNGLDKIDWKNMFDTYNNPQGTYKSLSPKYIPHIAIPTTAGTGSEVTQAAVISMGEEKNTIFHQDNYSDTAVLDPNLLITLPQKLTASTGFDAFCHAFESYIHSNTSPFGELASLEAIKTIKEYLVKSVENLENVEYRKQLLYAQTLAGIGLSNAGASAPHPLSEIIGGITHISHGEALALVFPEFLRNKYHLNIQKFAKVAKIYDESLNSISDEKAAAKLGDIIENFLKEIGLYYKFEDYNLTDEQFKAIIDCPILGFLPFGTKEELQQIILDSKELR